MYGTIKLRIKKRRRKIDKEERLSWEDWVKLVITRYKNYKGIGLKNNIKNYDMK